MKVQISQRINWVNKFLSVAEMVAIENEADQLGLSFSQLMENAGKSLADVISRNFKDIEKKDILALVGKGNNGGDALVALRVLSERGWSTTAYLVDRKVEGDSIADQYVSSGGNLLNNLDDPKLEKLEALVTENKLIIDGLLGTGGKLPLRAPYKEVLVKIKRNLTEENAPLIIAVDCPSGADCVSGDVAKETIPANLTVCMAAVKSGMFKFPAFETLGKLDVVSIGLNEDQPLWKGISRFVADKDFVESKLPIRKMNSHKGTFGTAMVVAGSLKYTGAALLAGKSAFRSGAGLGSMAVIEPLHSTLSGHFPEAVWHLLPHKNGVIDSAGSEIISNNLEKISSILIGPGLGLENATKEFLVSILSQPISNLVLDADGLKLLAKIPEWEKILPEETIITPHPGEMSVLTGLPINKIQEERVAIAEKYAIKWNSVIVLKGAITVVASPNGKTILIPIANSALAHAGTGDVLAGLIVGLLAQGMNAFDAAVVGAWVHGQAGKSAKNNIGSSAGVLAGDLIKEIPKYLN